MPELRPNWDGPLFPGLKRACVLSLLASGLSVGDGNTTPLSDKALESLRSRTIVVLRREPVPLEFSTPGRAFGTTPLVLFGVVGAFADIGISSARSEAAGRKLIEQYDIQDPAKQVQDLLLADLRSLPGFNDVRLIVDVQPGKLQFVKDYRLLVPQDAVVLDVRTTDWDLFFLGRKWERYRIAYRVDVRLVDTKQDRKLAAGRHTYVEKYDRASEAPILDEMLANDAAILKQRFEQAARVSVDALRPDLFPADVSAILRSHDMKSFAMSYTAAWNSRNPASVAGFYARNGSLKINDGVPAVGRKAITGVARDFMNAFPDLRVEMDAIEPHGNRWHYQWTLSGTNSGPGGSGHPVRISGYEDWKIGPDGLVAESFGHFDAADYDRQLAGAPPAAAPE